jgi:hypothetical protein
MRSLARDVENDKALSGKINVKKSKKGVSAPSFSVQRL